ncbi:glycosyltransferase family 39 protein [Frondihabitans australicus]|uniref:Mannosyltransferase n=1 Tax=Frondihabitans australicus TaxID=386892 RepID=A0A495IAI8_9MICO|nr:glycosyltransferase family 39 protein [Frondihabitans australicus]RKR72932.1 mannosyltransferase [Frondihabitans australicus]
MSGALAAALGAVGAVVAFLGSWNVSLWTDEAATISAARRTLPELFALVSHHDAVHALYYLFIHVWSGVFGYSEVALRIPSALATGGAVVGVYVLAVAVGRADVAVEAAIIAIVLPRITWMGIEARSFGLSATIAVWATVLLVTALRSGRWRWPVYGVLVALGIAINIYVALLVVAHLATVLLTRTRWRVRLLWLAAAAAGTLAASPVVLEAASQKGQLGDNALSLATMARQALINQWFLGATPTPVTQSDQGTSAWAVAAVVMAVIGWVLVVAGVLRALREPGARPGVAATLPWILLPTLIAIGYSAAVSPLYNSRYFTFAAPAVALAIALGLRAIPWEIGRITALVAIAGLSVPIYVSQRQTTGKSDADWSQVAGFVGARAKAGEGVYFSPLEPTADTAIGRTTRYIDTAYPSAFDGLVDVTLRTTGAQDATLRGTSYPLASSTSRLDGLSAVWVIRPSDYPASGADADDALLEKAGFRASTTWRGPSDSVVEFVR